MLPRMTVTSILAGLAGFESGTTARSGISSLAWATAQPHVPATSRARTAMFAILFFMFISFVRL